ncbi:S1C family serine protease [Cohnella hongkongensis]|uniref:S1C family serine protease n=1 Tax=Cohnella hongkongensis TaxID=178337 RepID=A0ABV9FDC6_9BACL
MNDINNERSEPKKSYDTPLVASYEKEMSAFRSPSSPGSGIPNKRRNGVSFTAYLASFLVGAMLVGGFGYAADRSGLFGGESSASDSSADSTGPAASGMTASMKSKGDIAAVFESVSPAVVKIESYAVQAFSPRSFFGGRGGGQQRSASEPVLTGSGTGFFFSTDGYILTNEHVIADADELKVTVQGDDEPLTASVVGASYELDLAVLKVESPDGQAFPALKLGDADQTSIGDWVIAIGNPYGLDHTMTLGVLSAKGREITIADEQGSHTYRNLLQTDASINSGNSGGPLLNEQGEVVGMNTAVNAEAQGIGFAIPSTVIQEALSGLMNAKSAAS